MDTLQVLLQGAALILNAILLNRLIRDSKTGFIKMRYKDANEEYDREYKFMSRDNIAVVADVGFYIGLGIIVIGTLRGVFNLDLGNDFYEFVDWVAIAANILMGVIGIANKYYIVPIIAGAALIIGRNWVSDPNDNLITP
jgi:hypothetical protein